MGSPNQNQVQLPEHLPVTTMLWVETENISKATMLHRHTANQPWIFTGRTDAEAEAPIVWSSDVKNWLTGKDFDAGKNLRKKEKLVAEDEMAR